MGQQCMSIMVYDGTNNNIKMSSFKNSGKTQMKQICFDVRTSIALKSIGVLLFNGRKRGFYVLSCFHCQSMQGH